MDKSLIDNLAQDKVFLEKILVLNTPKEVQNAFNEKGVKLTLEEIELLAQTVKLTVENGGVLCNKILQSISGGVEINYKKVRDISLMFMGVVVSLSSLYLVSTVNRFETKVDKVSQSWIGKRFGWDKK